ncbi:MAG: carboxypeptidase-like regulatory domain-containing protein [bacterium]|nr:carboxypeptidase-like regulatory domain-containing protein [bacterium]
MICMRMLKAIAFVGILLMLTSCNKLQGAMKSVEGKVAGQVLSASGHGRGYIRVALVPADPAIETLFTLAEDSGNFMFEMVPPGEYTLKAMLSEKAESELPSDNPTVKVGPGRTVTMNVMLVSAPAE